MKQVFDALQLRFNGDSALRKICRKLVLGVENKKNAPNFPLLSVQFGSTISLDTFTSDIREYPLTWTFYTSTPLPRTPEDFTFHFRRVFDEANVRSPWFSCVTCEHKAVSGMSIDDAIYQIEATGRIAVQFNSKVPATRFA